MHNGSMHELKGINISHVPVRVSNFLGMDRRILGFCTTPAMLDMRICTRTWVWANNLNKQYEVVSDRIWF